MLLIFLRFFWFPSVCPPCLFFEGRLTLPASIRSFHAGLPEGHGPPTVAEGLLHGGCGVHNHCRQSGQAEGEAQSVTHRIRLDRNPLDYCFGPRTGPSLVMPIGLSEVYRYLDEREN